MLDPRQAESHFNLGLVYERRRLLGDAEREILAALALEPAHLDARNMLGVIYAEQGKVASAAVEWRKVFQMKADYGPARVNLSIRGEGAISADRVNEHSYCPLPSSLNEFDDAPR